MRSTNRVTLVGIVARDPIAIRPDEAVFSVATVRTVAMAQRTDWHQVKAAGPLAGDALDLRKGRAVYLEGCIAYDTFDRDGITFPVAMVEAEVIVPLGPQP